MEYEQKYKELLTLKYQIDEKLENLNFEKIKELIIWLTHSKSYQKLKRKDNQLNMLEIFCQIWLEEKKMLDALGISEDIFYAVNSLDSLEKKYLTIQFGVLRLETIMPKEFYTQAVEAMIDLKVSGIALYRIIIQETLEIDKNIVKLAKILKENGKIITALSLLQKGNEFNPENTEIILELSDCWMEGEQWGQAYESLRAIKKPSEEVRELLQMLEKVLCNENN